MARSEVVGKVFAASRSKKQVAKCTGPEVDRLWRFIALLLDTFPGNFYTHTHTLLYAFETLFGDSFDACDSLALLTQNRLHCEDII